MKFSFSHAALSCLALLALTACGGKDQKQQQKPPPPTVGVITAHASNVPLTKDLVGRLSPFRSADVRARVPGVLLKRTYDEGSDVKKGQVLFEIDPAPLKAALNSAEADLAQAQATYTNNKTNAQRAHQACAEGLYLEVGAGHRRCQQAYRCSCRAAGPRRRADGAHQSWLRQRQITDLRSCGPAAGDRGRVGGTGRRDLADHGGPDRSAVREFLPQRRRAQPDAQCSEQRRRHPGQA